jgi:hypothetical protein
MRLENWNPNKFDQTFEDVAINRLVEAAEVIAAKARRNCPVGTISRPMYKHGKYAGQPWTSRDAGRLKKSSRVVRKRTKSGKAFSRKRSVRVYIGNFMAYYATIVEYDKPILRPAFYASMPEMKSILGAR